MREGSTEMTNMTLSSDPPPLTFGAAEGDLVRQSYSEAGTILEYGSGGSTFMGAQMEGKRILSVESDSAYMDYVRTQIDAHGQKSECIIKHVDIGPTKEWGHPVDNRRQAFFGEYPLQIWSQPWAKDVELVLIDGRFRVACFVASLINMKNPGLILFDDYAKRKFYHAVEEFMPPVKMVGRMAVFEVEPGTILSPQQQLQFWHWCHDTR